MSVTLTDDTGAPVAYQGEVRDLKQDGNFQKAMVNKGTWIFYKGANFNDAVRHPSAASIMILDEKSGETEQNISGHNGSMYLLSSDTDALVLFKQFYYGGVSPDPKTYTAERYNDITHDFPPNTPCGVSSAIVVGDMHDWQLYTHLDCEGGAHTLEREKKYPNFAELKINDEVKSLRKK